MSAKYNLSQQEYEIMKVLWSHNQKMSLAQVAELLHSQGFSITTGTIKTYLQRLIKKKAISGDKKGRNLRYYPSMDEISFSSQWTHLFIEHSFNNSLKNFMISFTGGKGLTEEEKEELRSFLDD